MHNRISQTVVTQHNVSTEKYGAIAKCIITVEAMVEKFPGRISLAAAAQRCPKDEPELLAQFTAMVAALKILGVIRECEHGNFYHVKSIVDGIAATPGKPDPVELTLQCYAELQAQNN